MRHEAELAHEVDVVRDAVAKRERDRIVSLLLEWQEKSSGGRDRFLEEAMDAAINIIKHGSPVPQGASR